MSGSNVVSSDFDIGGAGHAHKKFGFSSLFGAGGYFHINIGRNVSAALARVEINALRATRVQIMFPAPRRGRQRLFEIKIVIGEVIKSGDNDN